MIKNYLYKKLYYKKYAYINLEKMGSKQQICLSNRNIVYICRLWSNALKPAAIEDVCLSPVASKVDAQHTPKGNRAHARTSATRDGRVDTPLNLLNTFEGDQPMFNLVRNFA